VKLIQWLNRLFGGSQNGPAATLPNSFLPSKKSSTPAPSIKPKPSGPRFREKQLNTPNVSAGRRIKPQAIVLHHTAGSYAGSVAWCMDPISRVSYHAIVAKDGKRTVLADADERTWHAGVSSWRGKKDLNSWSIGAAFEGDTNTRQLGEPEMASMAEYLVPLMKRYGLTLADVTDHRTVSPGRKDDLAAGELARFKDYLSKFL
jgi:N-acetyl-anhydromuramyl-L-alanine amidase AmpD